MGLLNIDSTSTRMVKVWDCTSLSTLSAGGTSMTKHVPYLNLRLNLAIAVYKGYPYDWLKHLVHTGADPITDSRVSCKHQESGSKIQKKSVRKHWVGFHLPDRI